MRHLLDIAGNILAFSDVIDRTDEAQNSPEDTNHDCLNA